MADSDIPKKKDLIEGLSNLLNQLHEAKAENQILKRKVADMERAIERLCEIVDGLGAIAQRYNREALEAIERDMLARGQSGQEKK